MGKKSKSKTPREMHDNASTVEEEKASSSAKKPTSEIDEVFAGKKRKGPETEKAKKPVEDGIEKPSSSAKKRTSEIDEIFAGKKRKKPETEKSKKPKNPNGDGIENPNKLNKKKKDKRIRDGGFGDLPSKPKKRTQDGFAIYTEEELGINKEHLESNAGDPELLVYIPFINRDGLDFSDVQGMQAIQEWEKEEETEKAKKPNEDGIEKPNKLNIRKKDKRIRDDGFGDLPSKPKKRMQDGFAIYTEEELGTNMADAGSTPLCPFDCSCCF